MSETTANARVNAPAVAPAKTRATLTTAFVAVVLAQIVNAMPGALNGTFQVQFHDGANAITNSELTWISTAFMIPLVCFELTFGLLGDRFGRRRLLFVGAALVVIGTITDALSPLDHVWVLWIGRVFDGLGAGILFPISLSLATSVSPSAAARAKNIAAWAGFLSLGAVIAPLLGGLTASYLTTTNADGSVAYAGWKIAFWITTVIAIAVFLLNFRSQESKSPEGRRVDIPGQITLALGLIAVLTAVSEGSDATIGWASPLVITLFAVGVLLLVAFVLVEHFSKQPLLHLSVFKNRSFAIASIVAVIGMFAFLTYCFSMSVWTTGLQQDPAWTNGALMVFVQGPAFVLIPLTGVLLRRVSPQWLLTAGFALIAAGAYWYSTLPLTNADHSTPSWTTYILPCLLVGFGFWLVIGAITAAAVNTVPPSQQGIASATTNMFRDLGFSLGPVVGGAIAFGVAASVFAPAFAGLARALGLPAAMAGQFSHVPPVGFLSATGIQGAIGQVAGQAGVGQVLGAAGSSLGQGFQTSFLVAGIAATVAALIALVGLYKVRASVHVETEL